MSSILRGQTLARYGNPRRCQTLAGAELQFFALSDVDETHQRWGWESVDPSEIDEKPVAKATVDHKGQYRVALEIPREALAVALSVDSFSYTSTPSSKAFGWVGFTGPLDWDREGREPTTTVDIDIPTRSYAAILEAMDLWLVAGRVRSQGAGGQPIRGAQVVAFDRDITHDDKIGTATTDSAGNFEIFFDSQAFDALPPDVPQLVADVADGELFGGPDLYFHVRAGGRPDLEESPGEGRTAGRENVGHCSFHELQLSESTDQAPSAAVWTSVGRYTIDGQVTEGFAVDDGGRLAFTGTLDFNGHLPADTADYEYRFRYRRPGEDDWSLVTDDHLTDRPIAYARTLDGDEETGLVKLRPSPGPEGWIAAPAAGERIPTDRRVAVYPNTPARLAAIDTTEIVYPAFEATQARGREGAGEDVPKPYRDRPERVVFQLQVRGHPELAGDHTVTLHVNNTPTFMRYDLDQRQSGPCIAIDRDDGGLALDHRVTVAHPYLDDYRLDVRREDDDWSPGVDAANDGGAPLETDAAGLVSTSERTVIDPPETCTYTVRLRARRRLTDGHTRVPPEDLQLSLCAHRE